MTPELSDEELCNYAGIDLHLEECNKCHGWDATQMLLASCDVCGDSHTVEVWDGKEKQKSKRFFNQQMRLSPYDVKRHIYKKK